MVKMILLRTHEADTLIKYLDLIMQGDIDSATKKYPQVHYSIGELERIKKTILEEV